MNFNFLVISQKRIYFNDFVHHIKLFNLKNKFEIYYQHTPILYSSKNIFIKIYANKYKYFYINKGFLEFKFNKLILLIDKIIKFNSLNKKKYLLKIKKINKKIKKVNIYKNIKEFLRLNLKLKNYNNFLYIYKKNKKILK